MKRVRHSIGMKFFLIMLLLLVGCSFLIYLFITLALPAQYEDYIARKEQNEADDFYEKIGGKTSDEASNLLYKKCIVEDKSILIFKDKVLVNEISDSDNTLGTGKYNYTFNIKDNHGNYDEEDTVYVYVLAEHSDVNWFAMSQTNQTEVSEDDTIMTEDDLKCNGNSWSTQREDGQEEKHYVKSTLSLLDGSTYTMYTSYVYQPINDIGNVLAELFRFVVPVILLISIAAAFLYANIVSHPIISLSKSAKQIAKMDLDTRCSTKRKDEIGILANSLNEMAVNLAASLKELEQRNELLQSEMQKEKELERKRKDFFNMASHELKTPITVLRGYLEGMIYEIGVYQNRDEYLLKSLDKLEKMEQLVRELLNISRMDQMYLSLKCNNCSLQEIINTVLVELEELREEGNISIQNWIKNPITIRADKSLISRIMMNVIKNAIVHSPKGAQVIIDEKETERCLEISVINTDTAIPEEELPYLFLPFYRVDKSHNRNTRGSGLGLYIISIILDTYHFEYEINNIKAGVEFRIKIPFQDIFIGDK